MKAREMPAISLSCNLADIDLVTACRAREAILVQLPEPALANDDEIPCEDDAEAELRIRLRAINEHIAALVCARLSLERGRC